MRKVAASEVAASAVGEATGLGEAAVGLEEDGSVETVGPAVGARPVEAPWAWADRTGRSISK
eukprot:7346888-Prymnesium_polylepis.1